jgi:hypothetical protein
MLAQRAEDIEVRVARASAGIPGPPFLRQQRAARRRALIEPRVILETDRDRALDPARRIERPLELAAIAAVAGITKLQSEPADGDLVGWRSRGRRCLGSNGAGKQQEER